MIKVNLIIDGNYLLMKNLFILKKLRAISDLEDLLIRDYNNLSKSFPYNMIYFVSDSKEFNWRKQEFVQYKGQRKKDDTIDWKFVFETYDKFKTFLKTKRKLKVLEYPGLEGDDFISHIVKTSNKDNYSNIIIASDKDLQQLLNFDLNKNQINIQWNYRFSDERLYLPENYQLILKQLDENVSDNIFNLSNDAEFSNFIKSLIKKTKTKSINTEQMLFIKIVQGDASDNIPSILKTKNGKIDINGRGIGEKGGETVYKIYKKMYPEKIDFKSDIFINNLTDVIFYYKKMKSPSESDKNLVKKNIKFNLKLITLDSSYIPKKIYENMINHYDKILNEEYVEIETKETKDSLKEKDDFLFSSPTNDEFNPDEYWEL